MSIKKKKESNVKEELFLRKEEESSWCRLSEATAGGEETLTVTTDTDSFPQKPRGQTLLSHTR